MTAFEFDFSLFGLLLGFALVEVLSGLVRATRSWKSDVRHYYLSSALGLLVALDLITFWTVLFDVREHVPANTLTLYVGFFVSAVYYWAASMIFPAAAEREADLDTHYFAVRRKVVAAVIFCNYALIAALSVAWRPPPLPGLLELAGFTVLFVALIVVRSKRTSAVLLTVTVGAYLASAVIRASA